MRMSLSFAAVGWNGWVGRKKEEQKVMWITLRDLCGSVSGG